MAISDDCNSLKSLLTGEDVLILDGALATELEAKGMLTATGGLVPPFMFGDMTARTTTKMKRCEKSTSTSITLCYPAFYTNHSLKLLG